MSKVIALRCTPTASVRQQALDPTIRLRGHPWLGFAASKRARNASRKSPGLTDFRTSIPSSAERQQFKTMHMHESSSPALNLADPIKQGIRPANGAGVLKTAEEVQASFKLSSTSIAAWARAHGFNPTLTQMVVAGTRKCLRGQSMRIAIALGMKADTSTD